MVNQVNEMILARFFSNVDAEKSVGIGGNVGTHLHVGSLSRKFSSEVMQGRWGNEFLEFLELLRFGQTANF